MLEKRFVEAPKELPTEKFLEIIANFNVIKLFEDKRAAIVEGYSSMLENHKDDIRLGIPQK